MKRKFAISDIHGCKKTFEALLDKIELTPKDDLYLLGDYIDRGPDSKGVLDVIFKLQQDGYSVKALRGNHEQLMLDLLDNKIGNVWLKAGGIETLASFGVDKVEDIPEKYLKFTRELPYFFEVDNYILVHAGLNFRSIDPMKDVASMMWVRDWLNEINEDWLGDRLIVHGHTPMPQYGIEHHLENLEKIQVIDIDNGCCFPSEGKHQLCAYDMTNRKLVFQKNVEDVLVS